MRFSQKLDMLMNTMAVNNKNLAEAIHVDPSLISRWRSGSRIPVKNSSYIMAICRHFKNLATQQYQKVALMAMMNIPFNSNTLQKIELDELLSNWLSQDGEKNQNAVQIAESFLLHTENVDQHPTFDLPVFYDSHHIGEQGRVEFFSGEDGIQNATLKLLSMSAASNRPNTISMFSDQCLDWLNMDPEYDQQWQHFVHKCIEKGDRINVVHNVLRNSYELFSILQRWLPLYMTGQVKSYYCPKYLNTIHYQTLNAVSGVAALHSFGYPGMERESITNFWTHGTAIEHIERILNNMLQNSFPMLQVFETKNAREMQNTHLEFLKIEGDNISMINMLSNAASPDSLVVKIIERQNIPEIDKRAVLRQHRLRQSIFYDNLQHMQYTDIINLPEPHQMLAEAMPFNLGILLGHNNAFYGNLSEFKEHISNIIHLLENYDNYHCILQRDSIFKNIQIQAKDNGGVFFTKESSSLFSFYLSQPAMAQVFYNYLQNTLMNFPKEALNRRNTIAKLEQYLTL